MRSPFGGSNKAAEAGTEKYQPDIEASDRENDNSDGIRSPTEAEDVSKEVQDGVRNMEAATSVWTKWHLIAAYVNIWLIYFVTSMQEVVLRSLNPYVTSSFSLHSLTAATTVMSSIIGGLSKIPLAKILDTWGRPQGLALTLFIWVIGYIMMAACKNVQTYAAAQVFSAVGSQGVSYCMTVFIADTSSLKNRSLMLAFATSPYVATTWVGGPISKSIIQVAGWRWGFGIFSIVVPVVVSPLCLIFLLNHRKAKKAGIASTPGSDRILNLQNIKKYAIDVDLVGVIILASGMALFLLPFSLWSFQAEKWKAPMIICMIIFGGLLLIFFTIYEKYLARVTFIPFTLLMDRTVFFAAVYFFFVFFCGAVWGGYFFSMLQVVWELDITNATYVSNIYRVGSCLWALVVGVLIRWTGRFKWLAVYFAVPLMMLGVGLMIHFRQPGVNIGYIVMTQIFVAFAGGTCVITGEMAMMAPSDHQHIAVIIAILNLFSSIGGAVGGTVSTAIWTSQFPAALHKHLPPGTDVSRIYASIITQLSYKPGTAIRDGISRAYGDAQRYMLITSLCLLAGALICAAAWRDIKIKDIKQVKGRVV
ncbi:Major Facilitator Superfamily protein [Coccidioides posadasii C735 delta SOWgp]|uniref:Major Facilitator Superfamily protein n=1 Tax=Coccidioides posadasii (strain C735) TaxID=222929 RepID=C5PI60_COCP7|nr:Major Facilitator Superfamily protein [Coccidioides posadasii C735 delta SOWgp]EER24213.1 Major Facilitator Superfamily protein [Coccidioides posadasii C735 delta SOWgp]|eukprot:XP_003066358.1 Major Facilitator Superfamily protein [Coccidioides posadasii C735 delta SOWgp]